MKTAEPQERETEARPRVNETLIWLRVIGIGCLGVLGVMIAILVMFADI